MKILILVLSGAISLFANQSSDLRSALVSSKWCSQNGIAKMTHIFTSDGRYIQAVGNTDGRNTAQTLSRRWIVKDNVLSMRLKGFIMEFEATLGVSGEKKTLQLKPIRVISPEGEKRGGSDEKKINMESCG